MEDKNLSDPNKILNPDVLLTKNQKLHVENIKTMPIVSDDIDLCVECGFCEPICPSRELTMTPRQRIAVQREIKLGNADPKVLKDFNYDAIDTCATDGLCEMVCPVNINTGNNIKSLKLQNLSFLNKFVSSWSANHFCFLQFFARLGLRFGKSAEFLFGNSIVLLLSKFFNRFFGTPLRNKSLPSLAPTIRPLSYKKEDRWVYFPSCVSRILSSDSKKSSLVNILNQISSKSGESFRIPKMINSICCSQPFTSKGYKDAALLIQEKTIDILWECSDEGRLPILVDTSPCTQQLLDFHQELNIRSKEKLDNLKIVDLIDYLKLCADVFNNPKLKGETTIHPTCSTEKMDQTPKLKALADKCIENVILSENWGCCGFAGDKGLNTPELNRSATKYVRDEFKNLNSGYSTSRTCEIGMMTHSNIDYKSIAYLVRDYIFQVK